MACDCRTCGILLTARPVAHECIVFVCYLALLWLTLSHYWWGSLTHQILIITFLSRFEPKVTESLIHYRDNRNVTCGIGLMFYRKEIRFHVKEQCAFWRQVLSNFQQVQFNVFDVLLDFYFVTCFSSKIATNRWKPLKLQSCVSFGLNSVPWALVRTALLAAGLFKYVWPFITTRH